MRLEKNIVVALVFVALAGCVTTHNRSLSNSPKQQIIVNDNLSYTIRHRPNDAAVLATYQEYNFIPVDLSKLKLDCVEMGYELAEKISRENDNLLEMVDGTLFVEASRNKVSGINSCAIKFRVEPQSIDKPEQKQRTTKT